MTVFAFRPNWKTQFTDRLEWKTEVHVSRNGTEQRIKLRDVPRRTWSFSITAARDEFQLLDTLLASKQSAFVTVPFWPDKSNVAIGSAIGTTIFAIDTVDRDYYIGGPVVIGTGPLNCEELKVAAITPYQITVEIGCLQQWPAGSFIAPARQCRFSQSLSVSRPTAKITTMPITLTVNDVTAVTPWFDPAYVYKTLDVHVRKPNRAEDVTVEYKRMAELIDFDTGIIELDDAAKRPFNVRSYSYLLRDRATIAQFRAWLHQRAGQLNPFWSPTWERNLEPISPLAGTATMTLVNQGMNILFDGLPGRTDAALRQANGSWQFKGINAFAAAFGTPTQETVTFDSATNVAGNASEFALCCFLERVVLNADAVEIVYHTGTVATSSLATRSVKQ